MSETRIITALLLISLLFNSACNKSLEDDKLYDDEEVIENYLSKKGYDYTKSNGVYHVILDTSDYPLISEGDSVSFWYSAFEVGGKIFDTNIKSVALKNNLDTLFRFFNPISIKAGDGSLIKGLNIGILKLTNQEHALLLFPSTLGYKGNPMGPVDAWTCLMFDIQIESVTVKD